MGLHDRQRRLGDAGSGGQRRLFPDWAGNLYALRADTGKLLWSRPIADYNGRPGSISRVSPAIYNDELIIGDNMAASVTHNGADVISLPAVALSKRYHSAR